MIRRIRQVLWSVTRLCESIGSVAFLLHDVNKTHIPHISR